MFELKCGKLNMKIRLLLSPLLSSKHIAMFNCTVMQISTWSITWHQLSAFSYVDTNKLLKFKPSMRMGKNDDLSDTECGMAVGNRQLFIKGLYVI